VNTHIWRRWENTCGEKEFRVFLRTIGESAPLIPTSTVRDIVWDGKLVYPTLSRGQIKDGPIYDPSRPISRMGEEREPRLRSRAR